MSVSQVRWHWFRISTDVANVLYSFFVGAADDAVELVGLS